MRVVIDEATIKIAESKEGLDVFYLPWCQPFHDGSDLFLIHGEARRRQDKAKIFHGLNVEFAFLGATEQTMFAETPKDIVDMFAMIR